MLAARVVALRLSTPANLADRDGLVADWGVNGFREGFRKRLFSHGSRA